MFFPYLQIFKWKIFSKSDFLCCKLMLYFFFFFFFFWQYFPLIHLLIIYSVHPGVYIDKCLQQ